MSKREREEEVEERRILIAKKTGEVPKKPRKKPSGPRKLGKLAMIKKELRIDRLKNFRAAQKAETELASLENRKSRKLQFLER